MSKNINQEQLLDVSQRGNGGLKEFDRLVSLGMNINYMYNHMGPCTALIRACAVDGDTDVALKLISMGADLDVENTFLGTALIVSSTRGHTNVALALIEKGANLDIRNDVYGTALGQACLKGHTEIAVKLIAKGARLSLVGSNPSFFTALMGASRGGHSDVILALLENGGRSNKTCDGETFISSDSKRTCPPFNLQTSAGRTIFGGHIDRILALLANGARRNTTGDGETFISSDSKRTGLTLNLRTSAGRTIFDAWIETHNDELIEPLLLMGLNATPYFNEIRKRPSREVVLCVNKTLVFCLLNLLFHKFIYLDMHYSIELVESIEAEALYFELEDEFNYFLER